MLLLRSFAGFLNTEGSLPACARTHARTHAHTLGMPLVTTLHGRKSSCMCGSLPLRTDQYYTPYSQPTVSASYQNWTPRVLNSPRHCFDYHFRSMSSEITILWRNVVLNVSRQEITYKEHCSYLLPFFFVLPFSFLLFPSFILADGYCSSLNSPCAIMADINAQYSRSLFNINFDYWSRRALNFNRKRCLLSV